MFEFFRNSRFFGRPVELYRFTYASGDQYTYRYTDTDREVTYMGEVYRPLPISRGATSNSGTLDKTSMEISMPHTAEVAELFRVYPPTTHIGLTIFQGDLGDPDQQFVAIWSGRILSGSREGVEAKLNGEPISTSFRHSGLRRNYQYLCPHVVYGPQCKADRAAASTLHTVTASSGRQVTFGAAVANPERYAGGMIEWVTPDGRTEARTVISASVSGLTTVLTLTGLATGLPVGAEMTVIRGCRRTLSVCIDEHANANNFGGYPWIPFKNPIGNISPFG